MKKWLLGLAVIGGVAYFVRRKLSGGYEGDEIDSGDVGTFGQRGAPAPEQQMSPAHTRTDTTPEQLGEAARLVQSSERITTRWPVVSASDVEGVDGNVDRLVGMIATRTQEPEAEVRQALDGILAQETPRPSYPPQ